MPRFWDIGAETIRIAAMLNKQVPMVVLVLPLCFFAHRASGANLSYSEAQATEGKTAYESNCASCHGNSLGGSHLAPGLVGPRFDQSWRGKSADVLSFHVRRMPPEGSGEPVSLGEVTYTNILAYLLKSNGFPAGEGALPSDVAALGELTIPRLEGQDSDPDAPVTPSARQAARLKSLPAVTDEMLGNPAPGDWLQWGRAADGMNFSPLNLINKENVAGLKPSWRAPLREGVSMSMPLVHQGIMFLHTYPDTVLALDATNGDVLWRYQHQSKAGSSQKMGLGLHGDKVFVPTSDLHVLALNARTGELVWDHEIDTEVPPGGRGGHQLRSAPLVVGGKVIQGVTASFASKGGFILGLDAQTGEEDWRFNTIARPGEPGGETWNDVPLEKRSGGSVWHQGTWDPELDLVYFGVAPTYDTGPLLQPLGKEGVTNDALYTNCTVALRPETGELVWYYQHMPNDQWDLDWAFERQIVTLPYEGKERKVVMNTGKMAIVDALDAATGEYLFSVDAGTQNVITAIDPETGAKTVDPEKMPDPSRPTVICPSAAGGRSWPPTSFNPETNLVYVPITEWCMLLSQKGARLLTSGVGISNAEHPDAADGKMGRVQAIDVAYQELAWSHDQTSPISTGLLATGGGLLFSGDFDPSLKALDDRTGEVLWRAELDGVPSSSVMSYAVNDVQYVAVLVGIGNLHIGALAGAYEEFKSGKAASEGMPMSSAPQGGTALWVFSLPR